MDYNNNMESKSNEQAAEVETTELLQNRRDLVTKLGKFAAYAAPFTVLALNNKLQAASASGPRKHK